jgi:Arm domain-containing DNA-binding protein
MPQSRLSFSDRAIGALPFAASGQHIVRDEDVPGFFLLVGARSKTFMIQGDLWENGKRRTIRVKVGEVGKIATREARAKAKVLLGSISRGADPKPEEPTSPSANGPDPTLRQAWERYRDGHMKRKGRSGGTIENYRDHVERLMSDWLDFPLSKFGLQPDLVRARHEKLSEENGAYIANGCMRTLRAIYNHARKAARGLPPDNPVSAVDWNSERRRDTALGLADLGGWFNELAGLENPVRREFHLFLLLSGHRPEAIKKSRREHLDLRRRVLHIPKPKGGEARAFDIPLSRPMIRCLIRVLRLGQSLYPNQATEWIFPADSKSGHLAEHKEKRDELSKWGNDLRQIFRTVAQTAGVPELDVHLLMNHSIPGVNAGYITRNKLLRDHLRVQQEAISRKMIDAARGTKQNEGQATALWIDTPGQGSQRACKRS